MHTVAVMCKQSEKLLDSVIRKHGNHVRQEEYEIEGGEESVKPVLDIRISEKVYGSSCIPL